MRRIFGNDKIKQNTDVTRDNATIIFVVIFVSIPPFSFTRYKEKRMQSTDDKVSYTLSGTDDTSLFLIKMLMSSKIQKIDGTTRK